MIISAKKLVDTEGKVTALEAAVTSSQSEAAQARMEAEAQLAVSERVLQLEESNAALTYRETEATALLKVAKERTEELERDLDVLSRVQSDESTASSGKLEEMAARLKKQSASLSSMRARCVAQLSKVLILRT